ncbi:GTPase, putative [Plasmodium knowlesi strain H]|uniref:GTPase, putative n=3 Tax=Plasmodium knowlesi TaxID=5850 RepID=A0A5K1U0D8_PLAKH|nr:tRNA modification GTPase, putative [Plasmodium knowlesi strain H]OTN68167.1 putative GTPase [Plasmodium knowlesi]CAA9986919.1 tRNA modification GTPase, putative [Plasmodium knowlesi strain H]SBO26512.1 GTPase, putative [Plasmodium knowlesi strain H]SBO28123.1 GTPase, putative [Plasmodium knowlesi strain H]VVS76393.1 tRNA modification GTPase, putative [Plasmodium knowlesi strain H]|eukprot:XP_002258166.1 GTPase, putative [Plasmodium knowlesi strain H]
MHVTLSKLVGFFFVTHLVSPCNSVKRSNRRGEALVCFIPRSYFFYEKNGISGGRKARWRSCENRKGGRFAVNDSREISPGGGNTNDTVAASVMNTANTSNTSNTANNSNNGNVANTSNTSNTANTCSMALREEYLARMLSEGDTIYALSSGRDVSAIAVVRMSGSLSRIVLEVLLHGGENHIGNKICGEGNSEFSPEEPPPDIPAGKKKTEYSLDQVIKLRKDFEERKMYHGEIYSNSNEPIDQIMYTFFKGPKSYTGEDIVEIYCHGSPLIVNEIMDEIEKLNTLFSNLLKTEKQKYYSQNDKKENFTCTCSEEIWNKLLTPRNDFFFNKIRLSMKGEFTRRSFLNGKMNLLQVEGLKELLWCKKKEQKKVALNYLKGQARNVYVTLRNNMKKLLLYTQVKIDLEDEHLSSKEERTNINQFIKLHLENVIESIRKILMKPNVEDLSNPLDVLLFGQVNSGKSTLMNRICGSDVSIVTRIKGSTIDVVQKGVSIGGRSYNFCDSAGVSTHVLREEFLRRDYPNVDSPFGENTPHRALERMGVKKTIKYLRKSACVLIILNVRKYVDELKFALSILQNKFRGKSNMEETTPLLLPQFIICVNKCDLSIDETHDQVRIKIWEILNRNLQNPDFRRIYRNVWQTIFFVSSKEGHNVDALLKGLNEVMEMRYKGKNEKKNEGKLEGKNEEENTGENIHSPTFLPFERHKTHLRRALKHLLFIKRHRHLLTFDIIAEEIKLAVKALNGIIGGFSQAKILNEILDSFCVGK